MLNICLRFNSLILVILTKEEHKIIINDKKLFLNVSTNNTKMQLAHRKEMQIKKNNFCL